jgi:hypothetical protein
MSVYERDSVLLKRNVATTIIDRMSEAAHYGVRMTKTDLEVELMSRYKQRLYRSITRKVNNVYCYLAVTIFCRSIM